ncbi:MAG: division/cell wall cluster transcriptional repressor MraZ [Rhodobacteraceae bacterium]|nr:division/cell wall cluster transcriptional repressor MraZ [Paracoccaceae bacterium]
MAETFRGEFYQKVDGKARVSIPAPFRRVLEAGDPAQGPTPRVVVVYGGDRSYLECYTLAEMARIEKRIARMQIGSPQRRYLERNLITLSQTVEVDGDGRIVLGPKAREKLGLADLNNGAEAVFAGTLDKFQLWRRDTYEAELSTAFADDLLPEGQDMLSLLPPDPEE